VLTVLTWFWKQPGCRAQYTAHHVNVWAAMVRRNLTIPHRLACVTDTPESIDPHVSIICPPRDFDQIKIPSWGSDKPQCLRRISMFRRDAAIVFGERFACMDLDCVIADNINSLLTRTEDIVLYASPPGSTNKGRLRPYNGSMLLMTAGARPQVYDRFTPEGAAAAGKIFVGSDQAWLCHILGPDEATWTEADGVCWRGRWKRGIDARLVFFIGSPKPWDQLHDRRVRQHYRR
jgi:hypothetical protein